VRLPQSGVENPAYFFESLAYLVPDRQLDPYFAEFLPAKPGHEPRSHQHFGCEFLFVLSGSLTVRHGAATHQISQGDAIYFDASTSHSYDCSGSAPATALIVTLQQPVAVPGNGQRGAQPAVPVGKPFRSVSAPATPAQPTRTPTIPKAG
jgi:mannose-6-phosphate isomerase-like protein (cupin superfamily)